MKRSKRRYLAALLALCTVLGLLAGCGDKDTDSSSGGGGKGKGKDKNQQLSGKVYVPQYIDLGVDLDDINGSCIDAAGENVYLVGAVEERTEYTIPGSDETYYNYNYVYDIYRVPLDGGKAEKLPNYTPPAVPEGYEGNAYVEGISAGQDGTLWVNESVYVWGRVENYGGEGGYDDGFSVDSAARTMSASSSAVAVEPDYYYDDYGYEYEDFSDMNTTVRRHISADGTELDVVNLSGLEEKLEVDWVNNINYGVEGNIYATTDQKLYVIDGDMNIWFELDLPEDSWGRTVSLGSDQACFSSYYYDEATETSGYMVQMLDFENQEWGAKYMLPSSAYQIYPGGGDYLFYYELRDAIYGWKKDAPEGTETGERLFAWIEADVNSDDIQSFYFLPDGRVAAITRVWSYNEKGSTLEVGAIIMTARDRSELPERTTLTFATMYLNYMDRARIIDFNKTNEKYRIEVKDYAEYNTASDSSAGLQKMNTEIIAGIVPDILCTDSIPVKQYAARGYLEDLWPFIDNDPDLGRDKLMTRPLEAGEMDGKLYEVTSNFSIVTVVGPSRIVGDSMSWTLADLNAALDRMPEGCAIFGEEDTKTSMLSSILYMNMENFVDWDAGQCYFDSDNFKSLLAFCNSFPDEFDYENYDWTEWEDSDTRILSGKQLLSSCYISSFGYSFRRNQVLFEGGPTYVGYPMEDGSVGSCFSLSTCYAISSTCKDKEGAWSYLRQTLLPTPEEDRYYGNFPINKADFDAMVEEAMTPEYMLDENGEIMLDENGEPMTWGLGSLWLNDGTEIPYHLPTQEEVDKVMDLYNAITTVYRYDENISEIVSDVAGSYFAGDRSLDDTAALIQNRVRNYVNESK